MKLIIALVLFVLCLIFRRSKFVFVLTMVGLWFFMTYCGETYDSQNYINEFNQISLMNMVKEPLYVLFVYFFRSMGLSYEVYHALSSAIFIVIIGTATYKLANNYNLVLGLFLIYPFALYVVQIRNFFAFTIAMVGLVFLCRNADSSNERSWMSRYKNGILYALFIICAALIHSAYLVFLLFLLAGVLDVKKVVITTVIALVIEGIVLNQTILLNIAEIFHVKARLQYQIYLNTILGQSDIALRVLITFVMYLLFFCYLLYQMKIRYKKLGIINVEIYNQNCLALKVNILCLVILPFIHIIREVFRIQEALMLFNYIIITNNMDDVFSYKRDTLRNCLILTALLLFIFIDDFLYVLRFAGMRENVLQSVFGV